MIIIHLGFTQNICWKRIVQESLQLKPDIRLTYIGYGYINLQLNSINSIKYNLNCNPEQLHFDLWSWHVRCILIYFCSLYEQCFSGNYIKRYATNIPCFHSHTLCKCTICPCMHLSQSIHPFFQSKPWMTVSSSGKCALEISTDTKLGGPGWV